MYDVFAQLFCPAYRQEPFGPRDVGMNSKCDLSIYICVCVCVCLDYFLSISCATVPSIDNTSALAR